MEATQEERILALLPFATEEERMLLHTQLGTGGGPKTLAALVPILEGSVRASGEERASVIQTLGEHPSAADLVGLFAQVLTKDRDLFVQLLALGLLRRWDADGAATSEVQSWLQRRLKKRGARKATDFSEIPMAIGYFAEIDNLQPAAVLLCRYNDEIVDPVDRQVLEYMWPQEDRKAWAKAGDGGRPNLTGLGELGHSRQFYLNLALPASSGMGSGPSTQPEENDARWAAKVAANIKEGLAKTLPKLECRREKAGATVVPAEQPGPAL